MLQLSKTLHNVPVMSLRDGMQISVAVEPIISPFNLQIIGWWCQLGARGERQVLLASEVRESGSRGLIVNDESALSTAQDLARHSDVLNTNFELLQKPVRTERERLGKVTDYVYDETMFVQKLYVDQPMYKAFTKDTRVIGRNQIIEVTDHDIVVQDTEEKATAPVAARNYGPLTDTAAPSAASSVNRDAS